MSSAAEKTGRKNAGTAKQSYLLEGVSRDLIQAARAKASQMDPPQSLKAVIVRLLKGFVHGKRKAAQQETEEWF